MLRLFTLLNGPAPASSVLSHCFPPPSLFAQFYCLPPPLDGEGATAAPNSLIRRESPPSRLPFPSSSSFAGLMGQFLLDLIGEEKDPLLFLPLSSLLLQPFNYRHTSLGHRFLGRASGHMQFPAFPQQNVNNRRREARTKTFLLFPNLVIIFPSPPGQSMTFLIYVDATRLSVPSSAFN